MHTAGIKEVGRLSELTEPWASLLGALRIYSSVTPLGPAAREVAQLPLYTAWQTGSLRELFGLDVRCTVGDVLIALASLTHALVLAATEAWSTRRSERVDGRIEVPVRVMGGCGGTYAPRPLVPNDRTLPVLIASSGECHYRS